jgi:dolichyl-phosphate-mannose-protein mannosyltransferase
MIQDQVEKGAQGAPLQDNLPSTPPVKGRSVQVGSLAATQALTGVDSSSAAENSRRVDSYALLLTLVSLLVLGPMLQAGYFWGAHDGRHSVYFLFEFDRVFQDGIWYPRWFADMTYGYGYPLFNIYGPLAFYAGELFHLLGADYVLAVKLVFGLAWVLSGLAMYGFVRRVFLSRPAAFVAGLAYVLTPYHLVDVYVRAALAESVALLFLPLTLWAFYEVVVHPRPRAVLFTGLAYAGMLFAHNGIALLFSPALGAWILFLMLRRQPLIPFSFIRLREFIRVGIPAAAGLALGLGLTGVFLIPLALEYRYINVAQWTANYYNYAEHFVYFFQLFDPTWGFGISVPGPQDGLSFQFGAAPFVLAALSLIAVVRNPRGLGPFLLFFIGLTILVTALMFSFSLPFWQVFGLAGVAQFPWRLLTLTTVSLSVLAGGVLLDDDPRSRGLFSIPALALGALILMAAYPYITDENFPQPPEGPVSLQGLMRFESSANEMTGSTSYAQAQPAWSPLADNIMAGKHINSKVDYSTKPDSLFIGLTKDGFHTNSERIGINAQNDNTAIIFNVQYYPGWRVYLLKSRSDEIIQELPIEIDQPYGRIKVIVPKGEYWLLLRFEDTPPRTLGTILSGLSAVIAIALFAWDFWKSRHSN